MYCPRALLLIGVQNRNYVIRLLVSGTIAVKCCPLVVLDLLRVTLPFPWVEELQDIAVGLDVEDFDFD
jgi:hypothetical protein